MYLRYPKNIGQQNVQHVLFVTQRSLFWLHKLSRLMPKVTRLPLRNSPAVETASQRGMPMPNKSPKFTSCVRNLAPNSNVLLSTMWKSCQEACYSDMLSEIMVCSKRHKRLECFEWFNLQKKQKVDSSPISSNFTCESLVQRFLSSRA